MTDSAADLLAGWTFADSNEVEWQPLGADIRWKVLGVAGGRMMAIFQFDAGYVGGQHHHDKAEFTYVLDGELISNGQVMNAGHSYCVEAGTDHVEFRTDHGATALSVFNAPG